MVRLDKSVFVMRKQSEEPPAYVYWMTKSPAERISAVEYLRKQYAGTQSRLQRVCRIIKRIWSRVPSCWWLCSRFSWASQIHGRCGLLDSNFCRQCTTVVQVLNEFGFASAGILTTDLQQEDIVVQLGYEPNRIDILTSVTGLTFDECFARSVKANLNGLLVNFIHLNDLKINKAATGRGKDIGDLENLP